MIAPTARALRPEIRSGWPRPLEARARAKRILVCPPTHYRVSYEINPWMQSDRQPDRDRACREHGALLETLAALGHAIEWLDPVAGCPDMCFTANAAVVRGERAFLANLPAERRPETPHHRRWLEAHGFRTRGTRHRFGGGGDALWCGDWLLAGYGPGDRRATDREAHEELAEFFGVPVVSLASTDRRFYDLDMVVGVLRPDLLAACTAALDAASVRRLQRLPGVEVLDVSLEDALGFGCNLMSDGRNVVLSDRAPGLIEALARRGFHVVPTAVSQFMLAGGGVRCLGLDLPP